MLIISLDPGMTTGIVACVHRSNRLIVLKSSSSILEELEESLELFRYGFDLVGARALIERLPSSVDPSLAIAVHLCEVFCIRNGLKKILISPGQWKPVARVAQWDIDPKCKTRHEKDAFLMARYYARCELGVI